MQENSIDEILYILSNGSMLDLSNQINYGKSENTTERVSTAKSSLRQMIEGLRITDKQIREGCKNDSLMGASGMTAGGYNQAINDVLTLFK